VALEARRGFFLMSSVCFVGSLDYYLRTKKDSEKWEEVFTHTERTEVVMQVRVKKRMRERRMGRGKAERSL
jgi:hypothetical protein